MLSVFSSDTRSVKPSLSLIQQALERLDCALREVCLVGDSLNRDMRWSPGGLTTVWVAPIAELLQEEVDLVDYHVPSLLVLASGTGLGP